MQLIETGKPVVLVLITGRPYALGPAADRLAAAVQAFFPGQEGGRAIAGVLSGRVVPSGKLPVEMPLSADVQQQSYLAVPLAGPTAVSSVDPTPQFPFGHGLSYTTFGYSDLSIRPLTRAGGSPEDGRGPGTALAGPTPIDTDAAAEIACTVRNSGTRPGAEVVQLHLRDPVAQVTRPVRYLAGFARVFLPPGRASRVTFRLHADRTSFHGVTGARVVEPGLIEVAIGSSSADLRLRGEFELTGPERLTGADRVLATPATIAGL
jgi:beta-xylosidase